MDIVERARADVLRSGTWADTGELILEMAEEIERLRAENRADKIKLAEQWDRAEKAEAAIAAEREACANAVVQVAVAQGRQECCGFGVGGHTSPPECCGNALYMISDVDAAAAIRNRSQP